jgi:hypothetical protein
MTFTLAKKTLAAIDAAIEADQGASFRLNLQKVLPHIGDAYRGHDDPFRSHMGASVIGGECGRAIWYGFHWTTKPHFSGRIIRLFNRGHLEEARFIAALLCINVQVFQQDANGKQYRISDHGGHFGGSGDGVGIGIPDLAPDVAALLEFKTHNDTSFKALIKSGVRAAKFEHFVQMQVYMRKMGLVQAMYGAANKNDDHLHLEIVTLDPQLADQFIARAGTLIQHVAPPKKINESPGWFTCKWCDHRPVCHLKAPPERNCRTCRYSEARQDGNWWCENKDRQMKMIFGPAPGCSEPGETFQLTEARQRKSCDFYEPFQ